jgi:hypothetical protein
MENRYCAISAYMRSDAGKHGAVDALDLDVAALLGLRRLSPDRPRRAAWPRGR